MLVQSTVQCTSPVQSPCIVVNDCVCTCCDTIGKNSVFSAVERLPKRSSHMGSSGRHHWFSSQVQFNVCLCLLKNGVIFCYPKIASPRSSYLITWSVLWQARPSHSLCSVQKWRGKAWYCLCGYRCHLFWWTVERLVTAIILCIIVLS